MNLNEKLDALLAAVARLEAAQAAAQAVLARLEAQQAETLRLLSDTQAGVLNAQYEIVQRG